MKIDTYDKALERKALETVDTIAKLRKRLLSARALLLPQYRKLFSSRSRIDFTNKLMISDNGEYALMWKLRERPDLPVSYENQQTSRGGVGLYHYKNVTVPFAKNPRPRKYITVIVGQGNYGSGWEDETSYPDTLAGWKEAREDKKAYRENSGYPFRLIRRRVKIEDYNTGNF